MKYIFAKNGKQHQTKTNQTKQTKMSSTKNTKDNRHVVRVTYLTESIFKIPDGLDLDDKSVVEEWFVKWDELHIRYVDGRKEKFSPYSAASECENKDGDTELINADDIGCLHVYEEEDEEKENDEDDEKLTHRIEFPDHEYCKECDCCEGCGCCECGEDEEKEDTENSWCNADCEKAEGCIECNPMAFCSAETFAKWQDDCVSRMNPITNE